MEFGSVFLDVENTLVGVHHHLEVGVLVHNVHKGLVAIVALVNLLSISLIEFAIEIDRSHDASGVAAANGHKVEIALVVRSQSAEGLINLAQMLVAL